MILALDGAKSSWRGEERLHLVLRDNAPKRAGIGSADRFPLVHHGGVAVQQWSVDHVE